MPRKVSWHFQGQVLDWAPALISQSGVDYVKLIDPPNTNPLPDKKIIARLYMPDCDEGDLIRQGEAGATQYFNIWHARYDELAYVHAFECANEPDVSTLQARKNLVTFTRKWVELMHGIGKKTIVLSLGVGWPDIDCAADLAGALEETDYWSVHEYDAPDMRGGQTWYCLRYRRTVDELRKVGARIPPLMITECGIDGGVINLSHAGQGWKHFCNRDTYIEQLMWYESELQKDDYVKCATIFTSHPISSPWFDFDFDKECSEKLVACKVVVPSIVVQEEKEMGKCSYGLIRPLPVGVGDVTQWFGENPENYKRFNLAGHNGVDYGAPLGSPVLATHDGRCEVGYDANGYGNWVKVHASNNKFYTLYAHLQSQLCTQDEFVKAGIQIGCVGSTGCSTGNHLHFGWRVTGVLNPAYDNWLDPVLGRKINGDV